MTDKLQAVVHAVQKEAEGVLRIEFRPACATVRFPRFSAGSHIKLHLPNGLIRSYSLCNAEYDKDRYVVGVLLDRKSRGGSSFIHQALHPGQMLEISPPQNNFPLRDNAPRTVLVAGGIGVTPILSMLRRLVPMEHPLALVYCARNRMEAAFVAEIEDMASKLDVTWHFDDERGQAPDLMHLLAGSGADSHYYCCGPAPMLDAFERACEQLGYANAYVERFSAGPPPLESDDHELEVICLSSNRTIMVPAAQTILDALLNAGIAADYSCKEGVCGACELPVLSRDGELEHRDCVMTAQERLANESMMVCVSRCKGRRLVLGI